MAKIVIDAEPIEEIGEYVTLSRAMEILNVHVRSVVRRHIERGHVRVRRWEDTLMLVKADVEAIAAIPLTERRGGRPKGS